MTPSSRFALATVAGLVLAVIIHIGVILAMPAQAGRDAYSLLEKATGDEAANFVFSPASESSLPWLQYADPAATLAICLYDLEKGPYVVSIQKDPADSIFQSISFHAHGGSVFFSVSDRAEVRRKIDFIVATPEQMEEFVEQEDYDEFLSRHIRVTAPSAKGLVVLRSLAPFPSLKALSEASVALAECRRFSTADYQLPNETGKPVHDLPPRRREGR